MYSSVTRAFEASETAKLASETSIKKLDKQRQDGQTDDSGAVLPEYRKSLLAKEVKDCDSADTCIMHLGEGLLYMGENCLKRQKTSNGYHGIVIDLKRKVITIGQFNWMETSDKDGDSLEANGMCIRVKTDVIRSGEFKNGIRVVNESVKCDMQNGYFVDRVAKGYDYAALRKFKFEEHVHDLAKRDVSLSQQREVCQRRMSTEGCQCECQVPIPLSGELQLYLIAEYAKPVLNGAKYAKRKPVLNGSGAA